MKKGWTRRLLWAGAAVLGLAGLWAVWFFAGNRLTLEVTLVGAAEMDLEYGEEFKDPGVQVRLYGTHFWKEGVTPQAARVTCLGEPDLQRLGSYTLRYQVKVRNLQGEVTRTVRIVDTQCPQIILTEDPPEIWTREGPYQEAGYRAVDNYDGDITDRVIRTEEMGMVTYGVVDSSGNPAYAQRRIPAGDFRAPEIFLVGGRNQTIPAGRVYREPGYEALDNVDGDVTALVEVAGEVDWLRPGTYPVTYTVTDRAGNTAEMIRRVVVEARDRVPEVWPGEKTVYLTFDDGPGPDTLRLLEVLDRYGVKATFFVTDSGYPELLRQIVDRGHSIGIHTATHDYGKIYADPESYFEDLYKMQSIIAEVTGVTTTLLRFPGGSSNTVSHRTCPGLMSTLVEAVQDGGFQYFDWNVDSNDAGGARKWEEVTENVLEGIRAHRVSLVLQHDIHPYSVDAVEQILIWGLDHGYRFLPLDPSSPGMHHGVNN